MTWATKKFSKFLVENVGNDFWEKDDLFRIDPLFCPKQDELQSAIRSVYLARGGATHGGRPYPPSIAIGIGPTVPAGVFRDLDFDPANTKIMPIPPVVWFERLVNSAICNFVREMASSETEKR